MNIIVIGILITVIMILYIIFAQFWMFICDTVLDVFEKFFPVDGKKISQSEYGGQRHLQYIRNCKRILYTSLLTSCKLNSYLADIDEQAENMFFGW